MAQVLGKNGCSEEVTSYPVPISILTSARKGIKPGSIWGGGGGVETSYQHL